MSLLPGDRGFESISSTGESFANLTSSSKDRFDELVGHTVVNAQDEKVGNPAPVVSRDLRALSVQIAAALKMLPSSDSPAPCHFISRAGDPILEPPRPNFQPPSPRPRSRHPTWVPRRPCRH